MASNLIGRYVWLVDTLRRHKRLTFQEINELWQESGLGYGDVFPKRTFSRGGLRQGKMGVS